jgi:hypothetical protein
MIATAYAGLLVSRSAQTCSCGFSEVPGSHALSTIIIAYFYFCNNNFWIGKRTF